MWLDISTNTTWPLSLGSAQNCELLLSDDYTHTFICPMWQQIMGSEKETTGSTGLFVRRLSHRPDLAQRFSSMDIIAQDVQHDVEVPSMQLLPGQLYLPATFHIEIPQGTVTGMLLQRLPNLNTWT
jgi:hypothetical protein